MKILHLSNEIRHELGCAASLSMLGYDVTYLHLGDGYEHMKRRVVYVDEGPVRVNFAQINSPTLFNSIVNPKTLILKEIRENMFDLVITTPSTPFYIAHYIAKKLKVSLILRIWGIRAQKIQENIMIGRSYVDLLNFIPSISHNAIQFSLANFLVTLERSTQRFITKMPLIKNSICIYPTYAALYSNDNNNYELDYKDYILSVVTPSRSGVGFRLDRQLFKILMLIAKRNPIIKVVVLGGAPTEIRSKFGLTKFPLNLIVAGRIMNDNALRDLYRKAKLIVIPVFFKSVSNRLLEAFFYGKPILTNSIAKNLHPELQHLHHAFISDSYHEYPEIVRKVIRNDGLLENLSLGAREAYGKFFSAKRCSIAMLHVIRSLIHNIS